MTLDELKKDIEGQIAALEKEREQAARNELAVKNHLEQAQANTAFVAGQLAAARSVLAKLTEKPKEAK